MAEIRIPKTSLVVLCGPAASGKSTFARRYFPPEWVVSSDQCRKMVCGDEANQAASADAFSLLYEIVERRLKWGQMTVVDATSLSPIARHRLLELAHRYDFQPVALLFNIDLETCQRWDENRSRKVGLEILTRQMEKLAAAQAQIKSEGFYKVFALEREDLDSSKIVLVPLRVESVPPPPYDILGDIHGCADELEAMLIRLGYKQDEKGIWQTPSERTLVFIGDLTDYGEKSVEVVWMVHSLMEQMKVVYIAGDHCQRLYDYLTGKQKLENGGGFETTLAQLHHLDDSEREKWIQTFINLFRRALPYAMLDGGKLIASHAGIRHRMVGRLSSRIIRYCLHGESEGRYSRQSIVPTQTSLAANITHPLVVSGHTPRQDFEQSGHTLYIDLGCVFGGSLGAFRYPEMEMIKIPARKKYSTS